MVRRSVPEQSYQYEYDADGNLLRMWLAADMNCDGLVDFGDINAFVDAVVDPVAWHLAYPNCNILNGDLNGDGATDFGDINDFVSLVQTGNTGASRTFTWDGENRLVAVAPTAGTRIPDGAHRVAFKYDYMGRRVQKHVETWVEDPNDPNNSAWTDGQTWKYVWSSWRTLLELGAAPTEDNVISAYTWGLDLAGQASGGSALPQGLEGAGTIGGLLAASWPASALPSRATDLNVAYCYDGNGNVTQVVDWSQDPNDPNAALVARYEYDPFGNVVSYAGQYAETNRFRFSTKTWDDETGLGYWGYRYYNPTLGRWVSRDPIEERGGQHLYAYVFNSPVQYIDPLGQQCNRQPFDWSVIVLGTNVGSVDRGQIATTISVTSRGTPARCKEVRWVQLIKEESTKKLGPLVWTTGTHGKWVLDIGDEPTPIPWYPKVKYQSTPGVIDRWILEDQPGLTWDDFITIAFEQEFESCAICVNTCMGEEFGCVIGCASWGHTWASVSGAPDSHFWWGDGAERSRASRRMWREFSRISKDTTFGIPIYAECPK